MTARILIRTHSLWNILERAGPVANSMDLKSACENVAFFGFGYLIRDLLYVRDASGEIKLLNQLAIIFAYLSGRNKMN